MRSSGHSCETLGVPGGSESRQPLDLVRPQREAADPRGFACALRPPSDTHPAAMGQRAGPLQTRALHLQEARWGWGQNTPGPSRWPRRGVPSSPRAASRGAMPPCPGLGWRAPADLTSNHGPEPFPAALQGGESASSAGPASGGGITFSADRAPVCTQIPTRVGKSQPHGAGLLDTD